jgi:hypothetical protein
MHIYTRMQILPSLSVDITYTHSIFHFNPLFLFCYYSTLIQMASSSSFPKSPFDLNLTVDPSSTNVGQPTFPFLTEPQIVGESIILDDATAIRVANNLPTPCDEKVLANRSDHMSIADSLVLSIRSAASISSMGRRLLARNNEIQMLTVQVQDLKRKLAASQNENLTLRNTNKQLQKLVTGYSNDTQAKLNELQKSSDRIQNDHERLAGMVQMPPTSSHLQ